MLLILAHHDFKVDILLGLMRRISDLDTATPREVGMEEASDPELLAWAAEAEHIILTHDRKTLPMHAADRMAAGERVAGVIVVPRPWSSEHAIDQLELILLCTDTSDWRNVVCTLPL